MHLNRKTHEITIITIPHDAIKHIHYVQIYSLGLNMDPHIKDAYQGISLNVFTKYTLSIFH